ncbi:MAG: NAD(P)-dependent oxidoreductase [Anaerolineales bacterium]|nr:NAD(P)-dependent oxidoreductase [Anaerolineales bacterium]HJN42164.1 NAD(P)-dependent oxidoreductase [Anaerolineales bacterium]
MTEERFLITGALGCLGAWTVANLVRSGIPTTAFDLDSDVYRLRHLLTDDELSCVTKARGDVTDLDVLDRVVADNGITNIVHLAALQVPSCRADPLAGARVNVVGTTSVFEVARRRRDLVQRVIYASSAAVYGPQSVYAVSPVPSKAILRPGTHYGVYKRANESTARIYWQNEGISSIGLRPYIVYGVGRDQGLTSGATKAMLAAAVGQEYCIRHGGRADFQFTEDVARIFVACARLDYAGASAHNLPGNGAHVRDVISAIEAAAPQAEGKISFDSHVLLPFPEALGDASLVNILGAVEATPLGEGVQRTVEHFAQLASLGQVDVDRLLA